MSGDQSTMGMRGHVQQKFLNDMIDSTESWKILVLDDSSTKIISSALTMYDIMEHRVTLVEQLSKGRQPFPEMDAVYFIAPTKESAKLVARDFESAAKAKYKNVHLFFSDTITPDVMKIIQSNALLASRIKAFQELNIDFLSSENNVFQFDLPKTLEKLHGSLPDPNYPAILGRKLATVCITLNEHPCIRFQASSPYCREIATVLHETLLKFKNSNPDFVVHGDDERGDGERGNMLILDRTFDTITPLMHEYTYQAMVMDLLKVDEGKILFKTTTGKANDVPKEALLNESDHLWTELRYDHIAKVIQVIKDRMSDIIQNSAVAKRGTEEQTITAMAAAVRELPEYQQTMNKLGQHVAIAQQCMDAFGKERLMNLSQVEQTMSTGVDEEGKEVKGQKLVALLLDTLKSKIDNSQKIRILCIFIASQRNATPEDRRQLIQASKLTVAEQEVLINLDNISSVMNSYEASSSGMAAKSSMFSSIFRRQSIVHAPTVEGEYADTRHVGQLKVLLEQLLSGDLPTDRYPSFGIAAAIVKDGKSTVKSVRKYGANSRWGKKNASQLSGGRYMVFIAGGVGYSELRTAYEMMQMKSKEVIIGSSNLLTPEQYVRNVTYLNSSEPVSKSK